MTMDTMHLCTAADRRYALPMATLINSIIDKCSSGPVVVHVLQTDIPHRMMRKLHKMCAGTNVSLDFVDMSGYKFDFDLSATPHWTSAIFYRIMIPEIFSTAAFASIPSTSLDTPCVFPAHPPVICTFVIIPLSSISTFISLEHTPLGLYVIVFIFTNPFVLSENTYTKIIISQSFAK